MKAPPMGAVAGRVLPAPVPAPWAPAAPLAVQPTVAPALEEVPGQERERQLHQKLSTQAEAVGAAAVAEAAVPAAAAEASVPAGTVVAAAASAEALQRC